MSELGDYLKLGVDLSNEHARLEDVFREWPTDRCVFLRVCRPHPEVAAFIDRWLFLHSLEKLEEGGVVEEPYTIYLSTDPPKYRIMLNAGLTRSPSATVLVSEDLFWSVAAGIESMYSAYVTSKNLVVLSATNIELADIAHMDRLIKTINGQLVERGISLADIVR